VFGAGISRDGHRIAYVRYAANKMTLVIDALPLGGPRMEMRCLDDCMAPAWSPDGTQIAYGRGGRDGWHVAVVRVDGTGERVLTSSRAARDADRYVEWLSDHEVIYTSVNNGVLRVVDVIANVDRPFLGMASGWMFMPTVSSDGQRVAFYWNPGAKGAAPGIYIADRDGTNATLLMAGWRHPIAWAPDGKSLLVERMKRSHWFNAIERIRIDDASIETVWIPPADDQLGAPLAIPGTTDLALIRHREESDAWLLER
jgi:Tol biopolymer transport system component